MTTCWLAVPHFNGAGYVYNHFVRPCFSVNPQAVNNLARPGQEEFHIGESDNFLVVADRYVQEKGSEALEKLIFDEVKCEGPNYSKEQNGFRADMKNEEAETFDRVDLIVPIATRTCKSVAIAEKKILLGSELKDGSTAHCGSSVPMKAQKEWTCALCQVCTSSELVLQKHFEGKKHKAKEKEIEKTMAVKSRVTSTSNSKRSDRPKVTSYPNSRKTSESNCRVTQNVGLLSPAPKDKHVKDCVENRVGVTETRGQSIRKSQSNVNSYTKPSNLWCDKCRVKCSSSSNLIDHLRGMKHLARLQEEARGGIVQDFK
ncbi:hypothetical protein AQUCO_01000241v1 [Aquilegia coerulea]|nr:hypothetical protein AQUCO_01000241v1 [Aquilegia coerulea]PIA52229.1 hypothetical protein AQUCO_01000241v1 [Aquilegia coerulea]